MEEVLFTIERRSLKRLNEELLDIHPVISQECTYLAITSNKRIIEMNTNQESISTLFTFVGDELNFDEAVSILSSSKSNIIAVYNTYGRVGLVLDLLTKKIVMRFSRDDYHYDQTIFPVSFYTNDNNQILLIHGTKWNRLDLSNPLTGELLTSRADPEFHMIDNQPHCDEHYLDYFHGQLLVSPDNEWVVDNGWQWHPVGSVTAWNIKQWITNNCWESEDGDSKKQLWGDKEDWNDPICWLSNSTVGIMGRINSDFYDDEDLMNVPKELLFRIFDVCDGRLLNEFEICNGLLFFDEYLYCSSQDKGFRVYDISNGKVLFQEKMFYPKVYHSKSKEFLEITDHEITICKLIELERRQHLKN